MPGTILKFCLHLLYLDTDFKKVYRVVVAVTVYKPILPHIHKQKQAALWLCKYYKPNFTESSLKESTLCGTGGH